MQQMPWNMHQIRCCEKKVGQAMLRDEHTLVSYTQDFGKLFSASPAAVAIPQSLTKLQLLLNYAHEHALPLTIRGNGTSQGGQSLPLKAGVTVHLKHFDQICDKEDHAIWAECNASWAKVLEASLKNSQIPYVLPYNCNLSIGGVLSAGGIGASSFRWGSISSQVDALEVVTVDGERQRINSDSDLFKACLSGQGLFAVITKALIRLRPCLGQVRTFFLVYADKDQWLHDLKQARKKADYIEAFCSPSIQGSKPYGERRMPFAEWLYALHISKEYDKAPPVLDDIGTLRPWKTLHIQDETISSYLHRHDSRFEAMKLLGQWDLAHPWYECFLGEKVLFSNLFNLLNELPLHYASILQIVPISQNKQTGFLMLPDEKEVYAMMILNPGVHAKLIESCLQAITFLDNFFLPKGGKRYLSGYLGAGLSENYWQKHFALQYQEWINLKQKYDSQRVFSSHLYSI
jgi:hypothetical protein